MEISDRINQIMEYEKLSVAAFARKTGIADQTVRSVCVLCRNKPGFDFLLKIVQTFAWVNPEWLLTGDGNMKKQSDDQISSPQDLTQLLEYLKEKDEKIERLIEEKTIWKIKYELSVR
ncbi:MAG: hypothetical protein NC343_04025 [Muribaculum sp.]|nr:hypothetical protein [Muribaculaceae bacterium]MCM1080897.1 hypothetical protein [Muribaculum sp.]